MRLQEKPMNLRVQPTVVSLRRNISNTSNGGMIYIFEYLLCKHADKLSPLLRKGGMHISTKTFFNE